MRPSTEADGTPVEYCVDPAHNYQEIDWDRDIAVAFDQHGTVLTDGLHTNRKQD